MGPFGRLDQWELGTSLTASKMQRIPTTKTSTDDSTTKTTAPLFSLSSLLLPLLMVALVGPSLSHLVALAQSSCHLRELDLCGATLLVFTQSPGGLATSDQEISKQCVHLRDADTCFRNYTRRCLTPLQRELVSFAANSSVQLLDEYCSRGSKLRSSYLKHSKCFNEVQRKEQKTCMRDLQASLELLTSQTGASQQRSGGAAKSDQLDTGKRLKLACCTYRRFETCFGGQLEKRCGKEATQFVGQLVRRATSRLPETLCRAYKPDGPECRALLPKPGASPRGSKSNSILSRLLSAYAGL